MGKIRILSALVLTATILSACSYDRRILGNAQAVTPPAQKQKPVENADKPKEVSEEETVSEKITKEPVTDKPADAEQGSKKPDESESPQVPVNRMVVTNPSEIIVVVNKTRSLPVNWKPDDLVQVNVPYRGRSEARFMRKEAADALDKLFEGAKASGIEICAVSGFRSYKLQQTVFANHVSNMGETKARKVSAYPGQSEHQTGLAMDISSASVKYGLSQAFGDTVEGKWLKENAAEYGFIIRYLKGREAITGYVYEPWHIRYVGGDVAKEIMKSNITLEEYLKLKN